MPYKNNAALPDSVKDNLPKHAQDIYREAFNSAWDEYKDPEDRRGGRSREETAHAVAWAAVKKKYNFDRRSGMKAPSNTSSTCPYAGDLKVTTIMKQVSI